MRKYFILIILILCSCEKKLFEDRKSDPEFIFDAFWQEIDRNYPFFTYTNLNWDSVYSVYRPQVTLHTTEKELFVICTHMLDLLKDAHTNIYTPLGVGGNTTYLGKFRTNQITLKDTIFKSYTAGRVFEYGMLKNRNIGYIKIRTFQTENTYFQEIDSILNFFKATNGLIIDVRSNQGGLLSNSIFVASRFADSTRFAAKYRVRNGSNHNDFSEWTNMYISKSNTGNHYLKPVAILTNRQSFSATEWFVLFTREMPQITIIGDTTGGGSSPILTRELPNSWILRTSNRQTLTPYGSDFQYTGLYPDIPVWITTEDFNKNIDTILERAISELE
jgi:hypothetical protein